MKTHWAIYIDNDSHTWDFITSVLGKSHPGFTVFDSQKGALFSTLSINKLIDKEERHGQVLLQGANQPLKTMSSGEQKKALWYHILGTAPDYVILDNPFDSLDHGFQAQLKTILSRYSDTISFVQLVSRKSDVLSFVNHFGRLTKQHFDLLDAQTDIAPEQENYFTGHIPKPLTTLLASDTILVQCKDVFVSYGEKPILNRINWTIKTGDFWQLTGNNGSGKSTLLSMITGDNPKAYGQDITIFGNKKGTGESVWELKEKIGYFSPAMTLKFNGRHSIEHMLISGFNDSIGLYSQPTELQKSKVKEWLLFLNLWEGRHQLFSKLSLGQQRVVMTVRAMVKHPPLLILDEPTTGMDDFSANRFINLVHTFAQQSSSAIIYVSHRKELGLKPGKTLRLVASPNGSYGMIGMDVRTAKE